MNTQNISTNRSAYQNILPFYIQSLIILFYDKKIIYIKETNLKFSTMVEKVWDHWDGITVKETSEPILVNYCGLTFASCDL